MNDKYKNSVSLLSTPLNTGENSDADDDDDDSSGRNKLEKLNLTLNQSDKTTSPLSPWTTVLNYNPIVLVLVLAAAAVTTATAV